MGNDELNFTDEEARSWADDPRNQARREPVFLPIVLFLLIAIAFIVLALFASSGRPAAGPAEDHSGRLLVRAKSAEISSVWGGGSAQAADGCCAAMGALAEGVESC